MKKINNLAHCFSKISQYEYMGIKFYQIVLLIILILGVISYFTNCNGDDNKVQKTINQIIGVNTK